MANPRSPFLGKGRMHPFIHLSIGFWLYSALQCWSSMLSNCLVFHTSGGISSSPKAFLFLIFLRTESSSSCVNGPSLMSNCLLIILVIVSCVIFGGFPSRFSKCCFHSFILSCWIAALSFALAVFFLLLTSFIVCQATLDCLSSTGSLYSLICYIHFHHWLIFLMYFYSIINCLHFKCDHFLSLDISNSLLLFFSAFVTRFLLTQESLLRSKCISVHLFLSYNVL